MSEQIAFPYRKLQVLSKEIFIHFTNWVFGGSHSVSKLYFFIASFNSFFVLIVFQRFQNILPGIEKNASCNIIRKLANNTNIPFYTSFIWPNISFISINNTIYYASANHFRKGLYYWYSSRFCIVNIFLFLPFLD